jgi:ubiquitin-conjugating enzyme E2 J2
MSDFHPGSWNPAWSVATILTGLLSFMLSDEMTTGSVTSSDVHKRTFAAKSHSWNISQPKFREAFPDYCAPEIRDLPNMGEKEKGKAEDPTSHQSTVDSPSPPLLSSSPSSALVAAVVPSQSTSSEVSATNPSNSGKPDGASWADTWQKVIWDRWRWGILIVLALLVSRFSSLS